MEFQGGHEIYSPPDLNLLIISVIGLVSSQCVSGLKLKPFSRGLVQPPRLLLGPTYVRDLAWAGKDDGEEERGGCEFKASEAAFQPYGAAGVGGGFVGAGEYQVPRLLVADRDPLSFC